MLYSVCTFLLFSGQYLLICLSRHLFRLRRSTEERSLSPEPQLYSRDKRGFCQTFSKSLRGAGQSPATNYKGCDNMKCPYCSKEMQLGYLYNGSQPLQWIPKGKRPSVFSYSVANYAVELNNNFKPFKVGGYSAETFYCEECHIVIAKTE